MTMLTVIYAGTPQGRVIHSAGTDGKVVATLCGRVLAVGWQEFDTTAYAVTCRSCLALGAK